MKQLLVQTAILLIIGQGVLGGAGFALRHLPWLGLPLPFLLFWFIYRTARVLRESMIRAQRRWVPVVPWQAALWVVLLWQLPTLVVLPFWAPDWAAGLWQGAMLPVVGTVDLWVPSFATAVTPWLLLACLVEGAFFVRVAGRSSALRLPLRQASPHQPAAASGEWAPARRRKDIPRRPKPEDEATHE